MPKLNRYQKKEEPRALERVTDQQKRDKILETVRAIECHMMIAVIAMGSLQMLSMQFSDELNVMKFRYMRTPSRKGVSEVTIMCYLRKYFFTF